MTAERTLSDPQGLAMVATVKAFLDDMGWTYEPSEREAGDRVLLTTRIHVDPVLSRTVFDIVVSRQRFGLFAYVPFNVPKEQRMAVTEYLTWANYRLFLVKFEFDLSDGEIRAVCTVIPEESDLSVAMVRRMCRDVHSVIERYVPGILAIVYGWQTAQQAWQALLDREAAEANAEETAGAEETDSVSPTD